MSCARLAALIIFPVYSGRKKNKENSQMQKLGELPNDEIGRIVALRLKCIETTVDI